MLDPKGLAEGLASRRSEVLPEALIRHVLGRLTSSSRVELLVRFDD